MNKSVKMYAGLLASFMLLAAGCSNTTNQEESSADNSSTQEVVTLLTSVTGGKDDEEMRQFEAELSKLTGYTIEMIKPDDYNQVLMQKLKAGGEGLDLIYLGQDQMADLVDQGALLDLTDKIESSSVLSDTSVIPESEWDAIKLDDKLYASFNKKEIQRVVNINDAMLDKYDISKNVEETLDGYYQLFKELKEKNTDAGFYPFNTVLSELFDLQPWFASASLKGGIVLDSSGKRTVPWSSDESKVVWEWLQKLYAEGLLDPSSLTDTTKELRNKFQSGQTGVVVDWAAWTGLYNVNAGDMYPDEFMITPHGGTKNASGEYMLTRGGASLWGIPASSDNIEGAMKVLETFATQEGGDLLSVGIENVDYTIEDGEVVLTAEGESHGKDHGAPFPISEKYQAPLPNNPGVDDALALLPYASTESFLPESPKYKEIVAKHALRIVKGDKTVEDGLTEMREELASSGVTE